MDGQVFAANETMHVAWASTALDGNVLISLYRQNHEIVRQYVPVTDGAWDWQVCNQLESRNDYSIRLVYSTCLTWAAPDPVTFGIVGGASPAAVTITSPAEGDIVTVGDPISIAWTGGAAPEGDAYIELWRAGQYVTTIAYDAPVAEGSLPWTPCSYLPSGTDYNIRLIYESCAGSVEARSRNFTIAGGQPLPALTLTSPLGGETFPAGSSQTITWNTTAASGEVYIVLYKAGQMVKYVAAVPVSQNSFTWETCASMEGGSDYTIRLKYWSCEGLITSESGPFAITGGAPVLTLTSPVGGETFSASSPMTITWDTTATSDGVYIQLYKAGQPQMDSSYVPVTQGTLTRAGCQYLEPGSDYTVRLQYWTSGCWITSESGPFTITGGEPEPPLALTGPLGGETFPAYLPLTITWDTTANSGKLDHIELLKSGQSVASFGWFVPLAQRFYTWNGCSYLAPGSDYTISVQYVTCAGPVTAESGPFTISGGMPLPALTLTSPIGGETLPAASPMTITWNATPAVGDIYITLYKSGEYVTSTDLVAAAQGYTVWPGCQYLEPGSDYTIRLDLWTCLGSVTSESAAFTITGGEPQPTFVLTGPAAGDAWQAGSPVTINWDTTALSGPVTLELYKAEQWKSEIGRAAAASGSFTGRLCDHLEDGSDYTVLLIYRTCSAEITAVSGAFSIMGGDSRPALTLTSPVSGEVFPAGSPLTIAWEATPASESLSIVLYEDGQWAREIATVPVAAGSFTWKGCPYLRTGSAYTIGLQYWSCVGWVYTESDPFTILGNPTPDFTVLSPAEGEIYTAEDARTITWSTTATQGEVVVALYKGNDEIATLGQVPVGQGELLWPGCADLQNGSDYSIHLFYATCEAGFGAYAGGAFSIVEGLSSPPLTIATPVGGEVVQAGSLLEIAWNSTVPRGVMDITLLQGGYFMQSIATGVPAAWGSYTWPVCSDTLAASNYQIELRCRDACGSEVRQFSALFDIVGRQPTPTLTFTRPAPHAQLQASEDLVIEWECPEELQDRIAEVYLGSALADSFEIGSVRLGDEIYVRPGCAALPEAWDYQVTLIYSFCASDSNWIASEPFAIRGGRPAPTIALQSPIGGEVLQAGATYPVNWSTTGTSGGERIQIWTWHERNARQLANDLPASAGTYDWTICETEQGHSEYNLYLQMQSCAGQFSAESGTVTIAPPGPGSDCNSNGTADVCELRTGDGNANGVPDECDLRGDMDGNGNIDLADYRRFAECLTGIVRPRPGDFDADGDVDAQDLFALQTCLTGPAFAAANVCDEQDINSDGAIDLRDYQRLQLLLSGPYGFPPTPCGLSDFDDDKDIDLQDFAHFSRLLAGVS
jgi:hypothetical protein